MTVDHLLKGCRYVGYPEDVLMASDGTVLAELSAGRTINDREIKDAVGNGIAEAVNGYFSVKEGTDGTENEPVKRGRGRPPKVK